MSGESKASQNHVKVVLKHDGEQRFFAQGANFSHSFDTKSSSPKEMFLAGLLGCSAHDVAVFSASEGYEICDFSLSVDGVASGEIPHRFTRLELVYSFSSSVLKEVAITWVESSINTYCTTINTVRGGCEMSYSIIYNGEKIVSQKEIN
ncbi:MAG: OsmC family protein [Wolinella sp.]